MSGPTLSRRLMTRSAAPLVVVVLGAMACDSSPTLFGPPAPATLTAVRRADDLNPGYGGLDTLYARVQDADGDPVAGATVGWTVLNGAGTVTPASETSADGVAAAVWRLGPDDRDQAVVASVRGADPVLFRWLLVNSLPAATFAAVGGEEQTVPVNTLVDHGMMVRLMDSRGHGIYRAVVEWLGPRGTRVAVDTTDLDGYSRAWPRTENYVGPQTFTARSEGVADARFRVHVVRGPPWGLRVGRDTLLHFEAPDENPDYALPSVPISLYGNSGVYREPSSLADNARLELLENTGVLRVVRWGGHNIRHLYRIQAFGSERLLVRSAGGVGGDVVTVHARERSIGPVMLIGGAEAMPHVLNSGDTARASTLIPRGTGMAEAAQVVWSTSNPAVATVDSGGKIIATRPGMAVIVVRSIWGGTAWGYVLVRRDPAARGALLARPDTGASRAHDHPDSDPAGDRHPGRQ